MTKSNNDDIQITYVADLDENNYEKNFETIMISVENIRRITKVSFGSLATLSGLSKQTAYRLFNEHTGYFTDFWLKSKPKFETVNKLNDLIGKIIAGSEHGNNEVH